MKWNVDPVIVNIGPLALRYYSLFIVLGFFSMSHLVSKIFKDKGKDPEAVSSLTTHLIVGMLLGARLAHCLFYEPGYYLSNPIEILKVWEGGLASHGGYLGVILAAMLFIRKNKGLTFFWVMDIIAGPCLFVGGLIRLGNLFNSEILGHPTTMPWGIIFERVDNISRHPAMIYESIGYFIISGILYTMMVKKFDVWQRGMILAWAIIMSFTFRFFIEYIKEEQESSPLFSFMNMGQILSLLFVIFGVFLLLRIKKGQVVTQKAL